LLHDTRRPFNHLDRRDLIGDLLGKKTDAVHGGLNANGGVRALESYIVKVESCADTSSRSVIKNHLPFNCQQGLTRSNKVNTSNKVGRRLSSIVSTAEDSALNSNERSELSGCTPSTNR